MKVYIALINTGVFSLVPLNKVSVFGRNGHFLNPKVAGLLEADAVYTRGARPRKDFTTGRLAKGDFVGVVRAVGILRKTREHQSVNPMTDAGEQAGVFRNVGGFGIQLLKNLRSSRACSTKLHHKVWVVQRVRVVHASHRAVCTEVAAANPHVLRVAFGIHYSINHRNPLKVRGNVKGVVARGKCKGSKGSKSRN